VNRVDALFRRLKQERRCGLIAYVTCGDPDPATTVEIVLELARAGADAIELGVPFSDPIADGPVIQAAAQRALAAGTTLPEVLRMARAVRNESAVPLIAFSYLNPLLRFGIERFARDANAAGFDAALLTDLPPEAASEVKRALHRHGMGLVFLLAPTSNEKRLALIDRSTDGFIYYVSTTGVTGTRNDLDPALLSRLEEIRARVRKPLAVGFGISRREHYEALQGRCDAVVVGSAIVRAIAGGDAVGAPRRAAEVVRSIVYHSRQ
jgi:tryptophan synthase alpha chain